MYVRMYVCIQNKNIERARPTGIGGMDSGTERRLFGSLPAGDHKPAAITNFSLSLALLSTPRIHITYTHREP